MEGVNIIEVHITNITRQRLKATKKNEYLIEFSNTKWPTIKSCIYKQQETELTVIFIYRYALV